MMRLSVCFFALATASNVWDDENLSLVQLRASKIKESAAILDEEVKGNALVRRATPDGATNIEFVDRGAGPFSEDGVLSSVRFYAQAAGNKALQFRVYRPQGSGFTLVGATEQINVPSANTLQTVSFSQPVEFRAGDYIGWSHASNGNIPFDGNGGRVSWNYNKNNAVGGYVGFASGGSRTYSYEVNTEPQTTTTTTTTTTAADVADAVGDPHLSTLSGEKEDLCCEGGVCQPCSVSLLSGEKNLVEDEEVKGNALVRRATPDGATNIEFVDRGAGPFGEDGVLSSVRFYAQAAGNKGLQFRVYRPQGNGFTLVGATEQISVPSANTLQTVSFSQPVEFQAGDYIGWSHNSNGNIPFDGNGGRVSWNYNKNSAVGAYVGFASGGSRTYSYEVNTEPVTTTTTAAADDADAVGDPHISTVYGHKYDVERKHLKHSAPAH